MSQLRAFGLALVVLAAGCTRLQEYRPDLNQVCAASSQAAPTRCATSALQKVDVGDGASYELGFIEFDDQGHLFDRAQMNAVIRPLETATGEGDLVMVVFAHGWKHDAHGGDDEDGNIGTLRQVLEQLARAEKMIAPMSQRPPRRIVGIYLGWRGLSITPWGLKELSFWDRKNTAHEVGALGVAEVLMRLEEVRDMRRALLETAKRPHEELDRTRLVVVGHSFGGAIVYSALAHLFEERFIATASGPRASGRVEGYGDLAVLVNPAFEALKFSTLSDMANERGTYFDDQLPALAILTSEADSATGFWFPLGRWFSTWLEKDHPYARLDRASGKAVEISEDQADRLAVGHFTPYRTHKLRPEPLSAASNPSMDEQQLLLATGQLLEDWKSGAPTLDFGALKLERTASTVARNPYLVVRVDETLIKDHNDLSNKLMLDFVKGLILIKSQPEDSLRNYVRIMRSRLKQQ